MIASRSLKGLRELGLSIDESEGRIFIPPVLSPVLELPEPLVEPAGAPTSEVLRDSCVLQIGYNKPASTAQDFSSFGILGPGLWDIVYNMAIFPSATLTVSTNVDTYFFLQALLNEDTSHNAVLDLCAAITGVQNKIAGRLRLLLTKAILFRSANPVTAAGQTAAIRGGIVCSRLL